MQVDWSGIIFALVIGAVVLFTWMHIDEKKERQNNKKSTNGTFNFQRSNDEKRQMRDESIKKAVSYIETMCYYLKTASIPDFLKGKSYGWVYFGKAHDDSGYLDCPDYTIAIPFSMCFDVQNMLKFMEFKKKYPKLEHWHYREGILRSKTYPSILSVGGFGEYIEWEQLLSEVEKELRKKGKYSIEIYGEYMRIIPK